MKILRGAVLTATLMLSGCGLFHKKGYDMGACAPGVFAEAHVTEIGKDLKVDMSVTASKPPYKVDGLLYKFVSEDEGGKHYEAVIASGERFQLQIRFDKNIGIFSVNDVPQAAMLVTRDDDGSKLKENGKKQFGACTQMIDDIMKDEENPSSKT